MGMTIEKAIALLISISLASKDDISISKEDVVAIGIATKIMNKYQKIEKIINAPDGCSSAKYHAIFNIVKHYGEVLEDGNND